jgi:hypothetical protein
MATTYEDIRAALERARGEPDYPDLLRRLCLLVDAEKARLQQEGRFWCAQSMQQQEVKRERLEGPLSLDGR